MKGDDRREDMFGDAMKLFKTLAGAVLDARHEVKDRARSGLKDIGGRAGFVGREEFDVAFDMLSRMRELQDDINERLYAVEKAVGIKSGKDSTKGVYKTMKTNKRHLPNVKQGKQAKNASAAKRK